MPVFLDLPRELRDQIYGHLLTTDAGILLTMVTRRSARDKTNGQKAGGFATLLAQSLERAFKVKGRDYALAKQENGPGALLDHEGTAPVVVEEDEQPGPSTTPEAISSWLPTSVLYVSRQVSAEALEILYGTNDFIPNCPLEHLNHFLVSLPPKHRLQIRSLAFPKRSLMPLQYPNVTAWDTLLSIISQQTHLSTVKLFPPHEPSMYKPSPALIMRASFKEETQFWWPAAQQLIGLLQNPTKSLRTIQLIYPSLSPPGGTARQIGQINRVEKIDVEDLTAVKTLRIPRRPWDDVPEVDLFEKMLISGAHGVFTRTAWKHYFAEAERQGRARQNFEVEMVEHKDKDDVVLLLKPGDVQQKGRAN